MNNQNSKIWKHYTVPSADGASLSYYSLGTGPGFIILHGAVSYALSHRELGELLASRFTVHLVSRRGRGLSGLYPHDVGTIDAVLPSPKPGLLGVAKDDDLVLGGKKRVRTYRREFSTAVLETELSDLDIVIGKTGARFMLGISSGAVLMLAACLNTLKIPMLRQIEKMVIFEPPLQFQDVDTGLDIQGARRFEEEMASGDVAGGMVTAMKLVQLGPSWIPRVLMKFITSLMLNAEKKKSQSPQFEERGNITMVQLSQMLRYDFALVEHMVCSTSSFQNIAKTAKILLIGGGKSPAYIKVGTDQLERLVEGAQRRVIQDAGHEVLCNKDFRGSPDKAIAIITSFLEEGTD